MKNTLIIFILAGVVLSQGCKKEEISNIPTIEFVSANPNPVEEFTDLILTISYVDGDGDLGENTAGVKNCYVTDSRNGVEYQFRIKQLAPDGEAIAIQGELDITIQNVPIIDNSNSSETVTYTIWLQDRAGNQSEQITTTPISVFK